MCLLSPPALVCLSLASTERKSACALLYFAHASRNSACPPQCWAVPPESTSPTRKGPVCWHPTSGGPPAHHPRSGRRRCRIGLRFLSEPLEFAVAVVNEAQITFAFRHFASRRGTSIVRAAKQKLARILFGCAVFPPMRPPPPFAIRLRSSARCLPMALRSAAVTLLTNSRRRMCSRESPQRFG